MKRTKYLELTKLFKNQRKNQGILLIICIISVVLNLSFAYQIQILVDDIVSNKPYSEIISLFFQILFLGIATFAMNVLQNRQWHLFRYKLIGQMRTMMFQKVIEKPSLFFDERTTGDVVSAIMSDGALIAESAGISSLMLILNVTQIVIIICVLLSKNIILGFIAFNTSVLYFFSINIINRHMREHYKEFSKEVANVNQTLVEDVKAIYEIKSLNEKSYFMNKFHHQTWNKYFGTAKKVVSIEVLSGTASSFLNLLFPMFILVLGVLFTYQGYLSIGTVILFYTYIQKLVEPLNNLADFYRGSQNAVGVADRIYEYLYDEKSEGKTAKIEMKDEICLKIDIEEFHWEEKKTILQNIHESFVNGDKIYIQGESGKGKSTLLKLICGFYNVSSGTIKINGICLNELSEEEIFHWIKIQFQEPIILEGSIRENIELGQSFHNEEIWKALKIADLDVFVKEKGLDYQIYENGKNLSGGQKQRLALARVILRKPKILILDEATSAINEESERKIIDNLNKYVREENCILIVTSHKNIFQKICNKEIKL